MKTFERKIPVDGVGAVSSVWSVSARYSRKVAVITAHGAGNDMHSLFLSYMHTRFARENWLSVKFNFPYKDKGRRLPDRTPVLLRAWRAVIDCVCHDPEYAPRRLVLAGKSLGGRMASMVTADEPLASGIVFFGYPLHPARQQEKLRTGHFGNINCPTLFVQGSRDPLCDLDLLRAALKTLVKDASLHVIEGGDHSFRTLKRMGRSEAGVHAEIAATATGWIRQRLEPDAYR